MPFWCTLCPAMSVYMLWAALGQLYTARWGVGRRLIQGAYMRILHLSAR